MDNNKIYTTDHTLHWHKTRSLLTHQTQDDTHKHSNMGVSGTERAGEWGGSLRELLLVVLLVTLLHNNTHITHGV